MRGGQDAAQQGDLAARLDPGRDELLGRLVDRERAAEGRCPRDPFAPGQDALLSILDRARSIQD
jgi:hypothetical protein